VSATSTISPTAVLVQHRAGGSVRVQLPLIQHGMALAPSATARPPTASPSARVEPAPATPLSATRAIDTPTPPQQPASEDDPARNYPYFGGMSALLLAGWALLRRGRVRRAP
jgi:hypothetical protein